MGRRNKFAPRSSADEDDFARSAAYLDPFINWASMKTCRRVCAEFMEFTLYNNFSCAARALRAYVGVRLRPGDTKTAPGTIRNYTRFIYRHLRAERLFVDRADSFACWQIIQAAEAAYAVSGTKKAPEISLETALQYAIHASPVTQLVLLMMTFVGGRHCDIIRLNDASIWITPNDAQVEFRLTKNRRKTGKRFILRLKNATAIFGRPFPSEIQRQPVAESDGNEYPFRVAYLSVHRELVDIGRRCALPPATTYSFRNIYMERIFEHCNYVAENN